MESTTTFHSISFLPQHLPLKLPSNRRSSTRLSAFNGSGGRRERDQNAVDESMIELRVRIREIKMVEGCNNPPSHWMEWEKNYFQNNTYNNHVYEAVGFLQNFLLNVRPCLALVFVLFVFISVPISTGLLFFYLLGMAKLILAGLLLN